MTFGQRIKAARIARDLTLKEVADRIQRCKWTVINAEAGVVISERTKAALERLFPEAKLEST